MASLGELMVKIGADLSSFSSAMKEVDSTMKNTGKSFSNIGKSLGDVGAKMTMSVTAPVMALAGSAVLVGASFDKQMSKVMAISGATGDEFGKLREQALDLGASTSFSASEVAMAMEELASAGFNTEQILGATAGVLDLAASSGIGLAEASAITGAAINGFGLEAADASHVADVLAKAAAISATNATGLGDAFKYVAPVANALGLSIEETASAIGIMADAGIDGSQAGTTLRTGLLKLASPTKEMKDLMAETGSQFFDSSGQMKDMGGILDTLSSATASMTDEQKAHYLSTMFGTEAVSGFMALLDAGTGKLDKNTKALENSNGEAQRMATTMQDNLAGAWEEFTGALETLAIKISDLFKGDLQNLTNGLTALVEKFSSLSPGIQKAIVGFVLLISAIGPLLMVIGFIGQGIGGLAVVFGAVTAPVWAVIAAVIALVAGLAIAYAKIEPFREAVNRVFNGVKDVIVSALGTAVSFIKEKLASIVQFWNENGQQILQACQNVWNMIAPIIQVALTIALAVVKYVWNAIKLVITGALNVIMGVVKIFTGLFTGNFSKMWEGVKQLFVGAIQVIWGWMSLTFVGGLRKLVVGLAKNLVKSIKGMWDSIRLGFMYGKDAVVKIMSSMGKGLLNLLKSAGSGLVNIAKNLWSSIKGIFTSLKSGAISIFQALRSSASAVWNAIKSTVTSAATSLKTKAVSAVTSLKNEVVSRFQNVLSSAKSIFNNIKSAITSPIESAKNTVLGIIAKIKSGFANMKISIPKFSLPSIDVGSKSFLDGKVKVPTFKVNWNAKGAIFNQASILGGGQGVGEAGAEAVIPIQHKRYMAPFARAVADQLPQREQAVARGEAVYKIEVPVQIDGKTFARVTAEFTEAELEKRKVRQDRQGGIA